MAINFNTIQEQLLPEFMQFGSSTFQARISEFDTEISPLHQIVNNLHKSIRKLQRSKPDTIEPIWAAISEALNQLQKWQHTDPFLSMASLQTGVFDEWLHSATKITDRVSKRAVLPVNDRFLIILENDSLNTKIWKLSKRIKIQSLQFRNSFLNLFRHLFKQKPLPAPRIRRRINLRNLVHFYITNSVLDHMLSRWLGYHKQINTIILQLNETLNGLKTSVLYPDENANCQLIITNASTGGMLATVLKHIETMLDLVKHGNDISGHQTSEWEQWLISMFTDFETRFNQAGTYELPERQYRPRQFQKRVKSMRKRFNAGSKQWTLNYHGEINEWQKDTELGLLQIRCALSYTSTIQSLREIIDNALNPTFQTLIDAFNKYQELLLATTAETSSEMKRVIRLKNNQLTRSLYQQLLPTVIDTIVKNQLDARIETFQTAITTAHQSFSEFHHIFQRRDTDKPIPDSKLIEIPLQALMQEELLTREFNLLVELQNTIRETMQQVLQDLSEIDQVVEFNTESALSQLEDRDIDATPADILNSVVDGLKRAALQIQAFIDRQITLGNTVVDELTAIATRYIDHIQELSDTEKVLALQLRFARAKAKERFRRVRAILWRWLQKSWSATLQFIQFIIHKIKHYYNILRHFLGFVGPDTKVQVQLTRFLIEVRYQIEALPYVYQRLFHTAPLMDDRLFAARTQEMKELELNYRDWDDGQFATTAIVGEKGSGKTTLLNFAEQRFLKRHPIFKINLFETSIHSEFALLNLLKQTFNQPDVKSITELETSINIGEAYHICIFENIQNMFLRIVDGFDALERFLLFMSQTEKHIFWIVTCTQYTWNYFDQAVHISKFFQHTITMGGMDKETIESIIMKRHRISGYKLLFETPERLLKTRAFHKLPNKEAQQHYLKNFYFDQLQSFASGNITVTMTFWLSAIKKVLKNTLIISPVIDIDYSFLRQLPIDELFTLGALLLHESLDAQEHAAIYHQDVQQSLSVLKRMHNKRIVVTLGERYQIHYLLYRPVVAVLTEKNILH